jgi:tRNA (cmo5U34)-methyltransferase
MENWNDATFAHQWAAKNTEENPARKLALDLLLKVLTDHLASAPVPQRVLDLGCGHGVIAARVLQEIEGTTLMGVDGSAPMLDLAREQLAPYPGRWTLHQADFETMTPADLADGPFGAAIAVQSLHNSTDTGKQKALASVQAVLAPNGLFLLLDRIRLATPGLFGVYRSVWDRLGPTSYDQHLEGQTFEEHERTRIERGDQPGSLDMNLLWLREAGFSEVAAVHVVGIRALIAAVKR